MACTSSVTDTAFSTVTTSKQPLLHLFLNASALVLGQIMSVLYCKKRLLAVTCWVWGGGAPLYASPSEVTQ